MMKFMKPIKTLAALLMAVAATTACSSGDTIIDEPINEPIVKPEAPKTYTMTVQATMGGDAATTRALGFEGTELIAMWTAGDVVKVYPVMGTGIGEQISPSPVATLSAQGSGATTTLRGTFDEGFTPMVNAKLRLKFLSEEYTGQKGTLEYIAANCDYATADVTITDVTDGNVTTTPASFANQQAIVKFSLKKSDGTTPITTKNFSVKYDSKTYLVNLDNASSDIYVAIPGRSSKTVKLGAYSSDDDKIFGYGKANVTFENGKYYTISVKMSEWSGDLEMLPIDYTAKSGDVLTGKLNGNLKLSIAQGALVRLNNVNISANNSAGITCLGEAEIDLIGTNNVKTTAKNYPAVQVTDDESCALTINGNDGSLTATGGTYAAGIGSGSGGTCGNITINGGTITATGKGAAGIGSGYNGKCGDITISGGTVTATSDKNAAGIGSGVGGTCLSISISGGTVTATGGSYAAGIGSGEVGKYTSISIGSSITMVKATSGGEDYAPIGKGKSDQGSGSVTIDGTTIDGGTGYSPNNWNPNSLSPANTTENGHLNWTLEGNTWTLTPKPQQ